MKIRISNIDHAIKDLLDEKTQEVECLGARCVISPPSRSARGFLGQEKVFLCLKLDQNVRFSRKFIIISYALIAR